MLVDMVNSSSGADPVHFCVPGGEERLCPASSGCRVSAERLVIRQERLVGALGKERKDCHGRGCEQKRWFHHAMNFYVGRLLCQAPEWS